MASGSPQKTKELELLEVISKPVHITIAQETELEYTSEEDIKMVRMKTMRLAK